MKKEEMKRSVFLWLLPIFLFAGTTPCNALDNALKIRITDTLGYYDETVIRFLPDATPGFDSQFDAWKWFSPNPQVPSVFTTLDNGDELAINALPSLIADVQMELGHLVKADANYTLEFSEIGTFSSATRLILYDNKNGTYHNLRSADSIMVVSLSANPDTSSRFSIIFTTPVTITHQDITCFGAADGSITASEPGNHNMNVELYDGTGTPIDTLFGQNEVAVFNNLPPDNYMIEIEAYGEFSATTVQLTEPTQVIASFDAESTLYLSSGSVLHTSNNSSGTTDFFWDFGDGFNATEMNPEHAYAAAGSYTVSLTAGSGTCTDVFLKTIAVIDDITSGVMAETQSSSIGLHSSNGNLVVENRTDAQIQIRVFNAIGQVLYHATTSESNLSIPMNSERGSVLLVQLETHDQIATRKVWLQ